jgi:transcriptional regulator with XRE-family HTH domain
VEVPNLRPLREAAFLTQVELAEKVDLSPSTVNRLEMGRHKARIATVRKLAAALGVEPAALLAPKGDG